LDPRPGQLYCSSRCRGQAWRAAREAERGAWLRDLRAVHEASGRLLAQAGPPAHVSAAGLFDFGPPPPYRRRVPPVGWEAVMLNRRAFLRGAFLTALGTPLAAAAQQTRRIAFISATSLSPTLVKDLEDALRELGCAPGGNIMVEYRSAEGQYDRLPALIEDVLRRNPEVILSGQTPTTQAIRKVTDAVPIVMVGHGDPIRYGIVTNLARPENNITGVSFLADELGIKALELLKEAAPKVVRVAFFVNPDNPGGEPWLERARATAPRLGIGVRPVQIRTVADLERELEALTREPADAISLAPEAFILTNRQRILDFALAHGMPSVGPHPALARSGALLSYSAHIPSMIRDVVRYVDRLLRGAKARDLPIEQPSRFELILNLKTARALGLTIPPSLLLRADQVIE
jgi:putative ABC transport system substrate-binding protein